MHAFGKVLKRDEGPQDVKVPSDAKAVSFANRAGEPTVYFTTLRQARDNGPQRIAKLQLTRGVQEVPKGSIYIGFAEFGGGQFFFHAWEVDHAG